jgi:plastocyanin
MRLQVDLSEEKAKELRDLMADTASQTYEQLFNNALTIFEWAATEVKAGNSIVVVNERRQGHRVLVMPALEEVAKRHGKQKEQARAAGA